MPIHVKKSFDGAGPACSDDICNRAMALAEALGTLNLECDHLQKVRPLTYREDVWYKEGCNTATLTPKESQLYNLNKTYIENCQKNPLVPWKVNDRYTYYSVITGDEAKSWYSNFGRILLSMTL